MPATRRFGRSSTVTPAIPTQLVSTPEERVLIRYADRHDAGRVLGDWVAPEVLDAAVVVGLAGTGLVVAREVATALRAPLDVIAVHSLTVPRSPAARLGVVADDATVLVEGDAVRRHGVTWAELDDAVTDAIEAAVRDATAYRHGTLPLRLRGRIAVVVDDGIETGLTMLAAVGAVRHRLPARVVVASPVIARPAVRRLGAEADLVIAPVMPPLVSAREHWYARSEPEPDKSHGRGAPGPPVALL